MDPKEAYKRGFLLKCAEDGCTPAEVQARAAWVEKVAWGVETVTTPLKMLGGGALMGLGLAAGGGFGAGMGLAKLREHKVDPEEIKKRELIDAYKAFAEQMRLRDQQIPPAPRASSIRMH